MATRVREFDWSATALGPIQTWPESLKTIVRVMLDSRYAMWLGWGSEFVFFYNDAYATMTLGPKHPWALGKSAREVWSEIWDDIGPRAESVLRTGKATWDEGLLLFLERRGFPEETYHTFSYSPVPDGGGGIGGMLCVVTEDTERSISERRLQTLRELAARTNDVTTSVEDACRNAGRILAGNPRDVPMALIYLLDERGHRVKLTAFAGINENTSISPTTIELGGDIGTWPFRRVIEANQPLEVYDLQGKFGISPTGPWPEPPSQAIIMPLAKPGHSQLAGFFIVAASSRRPLDQSYRSFFDLVASQIATAIANAQAYEQERRRAESLAALDRAKTAFFSNVSHEFRTPLTLMLGPVEDLLAKSRTDVSPAAKAELEVVNRNGLRLLRLVNSLLDFSRIEAGRVQPVFQPTDLSALTTELAGVFRATIERAGLRLNVDCARICDPVYVDRDMWEKIVLNLLSNAFKFTFEGEITIELRKQDSVAELRVRDTGIGIPAEELPRLFERFHRVQNARGRTHEGTGIGLALVQELVKLQGGSVRVESTLGRGSTFIVSIPMGGGGPSRPKIGESRHVSAAIARPFVDEAQRWLPDADDPSEDLSEAFASYETFDGAAPEPNQVGKPRVLIADDNADMRQYLVRLLSERYFTEAVGDGEACLAAARQQIPGLILTDVMMPRLDGLGLLSAIRADPHLSGIPVIMLSARAGEESRVEGMEAGADDYLVKPFSAKEVMARIEAHLNIARVRSEAATKLRGQAERLRIIQDQAPVGIYESDMEGNFLRVNRRFCEITGYSYEELVKMNFRDITYLTDIELEEENNRSLRDGRAPSFQLEKRYIRKDGRPVWSELHGFLARNNEGEPQFGVGVVLDVNDRKKADQRQQLLLNELNHRVKNTLAVIQSIAMHTLRDQFDPSAFKTTFNARLMALSRAHDLLTRRSWQGVILGDVMAEAASPFDDKSEVHRVEISGPDVLIEANAAVTLSMMMHELFTNAVKYGALSNVSGKVSLTWSYKSGGHTTDMAMIDLIWTESCGPRISQPQRRGFGTRLIEASADQLGAKLLVDYAAEGLRCWIALPIQATDKIQESL